jgi:hypothetical protein
MAMQALGLRGYVKSIRENSDISGRFGFERDDGAVDGRIRAL